MAQIIVGKNAQLEEFPFRDEVHDMGDFIQEHPNTLGSDICIICREFQVGTTGNARRIDFLVFDTELNQIGIVELKKDSADEKVLLQTLRYANWIRNNPDSVRYQIKKHDLDIDAEEVDSENIKVVIVAPKISQSLAELCQYISTFEFEFIEIQRFKDQKGEVYALTDILEVDSPDPVPSRPKGSYSLDWFREHGVPHGHMKELEDAIGAINSIIDRNQWDLRERYVKWSVRFQTPAGRNAFFLAVRKRQKHVLRIMLGPDFKPTNVKIDKDIESRLKHPKATSRWWNIIMDTGDIERYEKLLAYAYENIAP